MLQSKKGSIRKGNRQFRGGISWFSSLILGGKITTRTFQQGKLHVHHIHHHHCHHGIISHPRLSLVAQQRNPSLLLPAHRPFWVMVESGDFTLSLAVLWIHPRQISVLVDHGYYPLQKGRFESNSLSSKNLNITEIHLKLFIVFFGFWVKDQTSWEEHLPSLFPPLGIWFSFGAQIPGMPIIPQPPGQPFGQPPQPQPPQLLGPTTSEDPIKLMWGTASVINQTHKRRIGGCVQLKFQRRNWMDGGV